MRRRFRTYYDGPLKDSGRTLEEIEMDIQKETERCDRLGVWEDPDEVKQ